MQEFREAVEADAEKALDYAEQAEKYLANWAISNAYSSLAVYHQLRASAADHAGFKRVFQELTVAIQVLNAR